MKLIYDAVNETERLCERYIESRNDKAILYPARLKIDDFLNPSSFEVFEEDEECLED